MPSSPSITIGIVSYNRLYYLQALVESMRQCIPRSGVEWILVDGASVERGMKEYLETLRDFDRVIVEPCTHAEAMNRIVHEARGDVLMILPEDVQFIVRGNWIYEMASLLREHLEVGTIVFTALRRITLDRELSEVRIGGMRLNLSHKIWLRRLRSPGGIEFFKPGQCRHAIAGAGILSMSRKELWKTLGPWKTSKSAGEVALDSSLGAEDDMVRRWKQRGLKMEAVISRFPVAADILTDSRGTKARVRGGTKRYGRYVPPLVHNLYYKIWDENELFQFERCSPGVAFEEIVRCLGFEMPVDAHGNLLKADVISPREPHEEIIP